MNKDIKLRIALDVILGLSIVFGWWYIAIPIAVLGAWMFAYFAEVVIFAFLHDALYGLNAEFGLWGFIYTIGSVVTIAVMSFLKRVIKQ